MFNPLKREAHYFNTREGQKKDQTEIKSNRNTMKTNFTKTPAELLVDMEKWSWGACSTGEFLTLNGLLVAS